MATINPWDAEVDEGSATPTPKAVKKPMPKPKPAPKTVPVGQAEVDDGILNKKCGGTIKKMASGGMASSRGDGCAQRGKTKGRMV